MTGASIIRADALLRQPAFLFGRVMHKRLFPRVNGFEYGVYYLACPLGALSRSPQARSPQARSPQVRLPVAHNRRGPISFHDCDHGPRDGSDLQSWARACLKHSRLTQADGEIVLISMPRVFGYVFNPVSFWLCFDRQKQLRAVLCEVDNTFGETHVYVCARRDCRPIGRGDVLRGDKVFHVSPMLERRGHYTFRFDVNDNVFGVWIDFYPDGLRKQLITSLTGRLRKVDTPRHQRALRRRVSLRFPLLTFKVTAAIHWQALKLLCKGVGYIPKPPQRTPAMTLAEESVDPRKRGTNKSR